MWYKFPAVPSGLDLPNPRFADQKIIRNHPTTAKLLEPTKGKECYYFTINQTSCSILPPLAAATEINVFRSENSKLPEILSFINVP